MKTLSSANLVYVGEFGVDAGLCWIGDPCHLVDKNPFKNWHKFCAQIEDMITTRQLEYGVLTRTGDGDGTYKVFASIENNIVKQIVIDFGQELDDE